MSDAAGEAEFGAKLAAFVKQNRLYGAAAGVVHGDELAWSGGAGFADLQARRPAGPGALYRIASLTKTFTGTAIMQLRDQGKLDLDDPAVQWLPELAASGSPETIGRVTIRRLLSHESGLTSEPPGTDWGLPAMVYQGAVASNLARAAEIVTAIPPNQQPKYSNLGYQLLGEIVHRASGVEFPAYLRREILDPLGLLDTAFEPLDEALASRCATGYRARTFSDELDVARPMPQIWAEGGLWSSVPDIGGWLLCQLRAHPDQPQGSASPANSVLAAATLREMHKPRYLSDEAWTEAWGITWYAVRKDDVTWIQHSGDVDGFSCCACFDRDSRVGAVVLVNGGADASTLAMDLGAIARRLVAATAPPVLAPVPTPEEYRALLGLYVARSTGELLRVEWRDGKLVLLTPGEPEDAEPLHPATDRDTFTVGPGFRHSGETVRFRRLPGGQVASVYLGSATLLRLEPVAADTAAAEPVPAEPPVAEPVAAEPVPAEPPVAEPVAAEPPVADTAG
jgi:CubicO group peptidase (beta-lactamase class C family)